MLSIKDVLGPPTGLLRCVATLTRAVQRLHNLHVSSSSGGLPQPGVSESDCDTVQSDLAKSFYHEETQCSHSNAPFFTRSVSAPAPTPPTNQHSTQPALMHHQNPGLSTSLLTTMLDSYAALQGTHSGDEQQRRLFLEQLQLELRAQQLALDERQEFVADKSRRGMGATIGAMNGHINVWSRRLSHLLESELVQARQALTRSAEPTSSLQHALSSKASIWPVIAALDPSELAHAAVSAMVNSVMAGTMGGQRGRRASGATTTSISVAIAVGHRVEDLLRNQRLLLELRQCQHQTKDARRKLKDIRGIAAVEQDHAPQLGGHNSEQAWEGQFVVRQAEAVLVRAQARVQKLRKLQQMLAREAMAGGSRFGLHVLRRSVDAVMRSGNSEQPHEGWSQEYLAMVGGELLNLLLPLTTIPDGPAQVPGFIYTRGGHEVGASSAAATISITPKLMDAVLTGNDQIERVLDPRYMPMLLKPLPWQHPSGGAMLLRGPRVVRGYDGRHTGMLLAAHDRGEFDALYKALDVLGSTTWRINARVLKAAQQLWIDSKLEHDYVKHLFNIPNDPELPRRSTQWREDTHKDMGHTTYLRMTREGSNHGQLLFTAGALTAAESARYQTQLRAARQAQCNVKSLSVDVKMRLGLAQDYAGRTEFYFPHNIDFRGRAYPVPPYLNHLGDDLSRGLLQFAQGRELGDNGLRWLFIHATNCFGGGYDKLPLDERAEFAQSKLPAIFAAADDPVGHNSRWWMDGENPWQLLACCMEIAAALRSSSPQAYKSHMPVHQDGSCNGLQHYAALGRDLKGATAVNLVPSERPQDVYKAVAHVVEEWVINDAAIGRSEATKLLARNGNVVDRKLVKQTIMTSVYGVTFMGARAQISNRLFERGWSNEAEVFQVATYLATLTLNSVGHVFSSAKAVMDWLAAYAAVASSTGQPVQWRSPMGFPILQPYYAKETNQVRTSLQYFTLMDKSTTKIDKRAQRTAFPPNYVHSIDASHMMMTAIACHREGIAFAGVHDSFWTHAATVDRLGQLLRREFVALHSQPLLPSLVTDLTASKPELVKNLKPIPAHGSLDLNVIRESTYFFS